jgi:hypothetical protein
MFYRGLLIAFLALVACRTDAGTAENEAHAWLAKQPELASSPDWAIACDADGTCILNHQDGGALVLRCNHNEPGCANHTVGCVLAVRGCSALRPCRVYTIKPEDM